MKQMLIHGCFSNGFVFAWSYDEKVCGYCRADSKEKVLSLSIPIVKSATKEEVLEIILHEIAHAIDFTRNGRWRYKYIIDSNGKRKRSLLIHDKVWREIAMELGIKTPRACIETS